MLQRLDIMKRNILGYGFIWQGMRLDIGFYGLEFIEILKEMEKNATEYWNLCSYVV